MTVPFTIRPGAGSPVRENWIATSFWMMPVGNFGLRMLAGAARE